MTSDFENQSNILRQCHFMENYFLNNPNSDKDLLFSICIETEINLYERLDILDKAIYEWKLMHPFLRCYGYNKMNESNNIESYFINADESKIKNSFINVKLLSLNNSLVNKEKDQLFDKTWQLIAEKELMKPIDCFNRDLLWRLTFIRDTNNKFSQNEKNTSSSTFKICVLLIINHSICDGRSTYSSLIHLFQIMEDIYTNNYKRQEPYKVFPGQDSYINDFIDEFQCDYFKVPRVAMPSFYNKNPDSKIEFNTNLRYFEEILEEKVYFNDGTEYLRFKDLIENAKINHSKFICFSFTEDKSKLFLQKCKNKNVKVNTCLKTMFSFAMKKLHSKYGINLETVVIVQPVDLRPYFINKYGLEDFQTLCCFSNCFLKKFEKNLDESSFLSEKWIENFWSTVKIDDEIFQNMMKNKEFLKKINLSPDMKPDEMWGHFDLTNYGVLQSKTEKNVFIIKELNIMVNFFSKVRNKIPFVIFACTIQNKMFFTIRYNEALINKDIIDHFQQFAEQIFEKIFE